MCVSTEIVSQIQRAFPHKKNTYWCFYTVMYVDSHFKVQHSNIQNIHTDCSITLFPALNSTNNLPNLPHFVILLSKPGTKSLAYFLFLLCWNYFHWNILTINKLLKLFTLGIAIKKKLGNKCFMHPHTGIVLHIKFIKNSQVHQKKTTK